MFALLMNREVKIRYGTDGIEGLFIEVNYLNPDKHGRSWMRSYLRDTRAGLPPLTIEEIVDAAGEYGFDISRELEDEPEGPEGCGGGCEFCCNRGL